MQFGIVSFFSHSSERSQQMELLLLVLGLLVLAAIGRLVIKGIAFMILVIIGGLALTAVVGGSASCSRGCQPPTIVVIQSPP